MGRPRPFHFGGFANALGSWRGSLRTKSRNIALNDEGSTAIEFAIASSVVLGLVFAAVDLGRVYIVGGLLGDAARQISRENQVRENPYPAANFQARVAEIINARSGGMLDPSLVAIGTDVYANFEDLASDQPVVGGPPGGSPSQIVKYRLDYNMDYYTPFVGLLMEGGQYVHAAEIIVFNEPDSEL